MMEKQVLSEAIQEQIGSREVTALVFCTHDLDPEFFEQYVLPLFLGSEFKHNRRIQNAQLDYVMRERGIPVDVFYEHSALAASVGTVSLGWSKHPMHGTTGVFHPKVVLALCQDESGAESLVVSIASANLTQSGWWRNVECAEVIRLEDRQRHGYIDGLQALVRSLGDRRRRWRLGDNKVEAVDRVRGFLAGLTGYSNTRVNGRLVPHVLPGEDDLLEHLMRRAGDRLVGAHIEVISPFFDKDPAGVVARIERWRDTLQPKTFKIAVPARDGASTLSEEIYDAVEATSGVTWSRLPSTYVKAANGEESRERSTHAKVYRFWRGHPNPLEVLVVGSHNFTGPALSGTGNWEVSVVVEPDEPQPGALLRDAADKPGNFQALDDDLTSETHDDLPYIPLAVTFDWSTRTAAARWYGRDPEPVTLLRAGLEVCRIEAVEKEWKELGEHASDALGDVLRTSALLICRRDDDAEAPMLVDEQNYDSKPDALEALDLTPAEIFALWSIPGLQDRVQQLARSRSRVEVDEDDLELADLPVVTPSMFQRFAGVLQAFSSLRARVNAAMQAGNLRRAGHAVYSEKFDAPITALRIMRDQSDDDLAHQYFTWQCTRALDNWVSDQHPQLGVEFASFRARLLDELAHDLAIRESLIETSDDPEMADFLSWFDDHFADEARLK